MKGTTADNPLTSADGLITLTPGETYYAKAGESITIDNKYLTMLTDQPVEISRNNDGTINIVLPDEPCEIRIDAEDIIINVVLGGE